MDRKKLEYKGNLFENYIAVELSNKFPSAKFILNKELYSPFLQKDTQIDLIMVTDKVVYVIEAKNWSDYIKGTYNDVHWKGKGNSQAMNTYNPVNQNAIHIRALRNKLSKAGVPYDIPIKSFIIVPESCQLITTCTEVCHLSEINRLVAKVEQGIQEIDKEAIYKMVMCV